MKVTLEKDYRKYYTLEDLDKAKKIIAYEKEDEMPIKDWAEYAAREALKGTGDYFDECLKAEAHTARNCRANDRYWPSRYDDNGVWEDGSGDMDVWLEATVRTDKGFLVFGAYLSDIWGTGAVEYKQHMYIRYFKEAEL
jgi:hypothetical protein